jgi:LysM repeat protein
VKPGKKLVLYVYQTKAITKPEQKAAPIQENKNTATATDKPASKSGSGSFKYYTIQKGDSLYKIAQSAKTTVDEIKRLNNFGAKYNLLPGQKIKVGVL